MIMKIVDVKAVLPSRYKYIARDANGATYAYENRPFLDFGTNKNPVPCDMWDVNEGDVLLISPKTSSPYHILSEELGDWRTSLVEL